MLSRNQRVIILLLCLSLVIAFLLPRISLAAIEQVDLLQYWAGAQLFVAHQNPYNAQDLYTLQLSTLIGSTRAAPVIMYNPPVILPFILPLAWMTFPLAKIVWLLVSLGAFQVGAFFLARTYIVSRLHSWQLWSCIILCMTFPPFYKTLFFGQVSWLLFLSYSIFLYLYARQRYLAAGLVLGVTLIKPHLLYLVFLHLGLTLRSQASRQVIFGVCLSLALQCLCVSLINSDVWQWYALFSQHPPISWRTPTLGNWMQEVTAIHTVGIRFAPTLLMTCLYTIGHILYRSQSPFIRMEPLVLIPYLTALSLFTSPYGWVYDQVLLAPLVLLLIIASGPSSRVAASSSVILLLCAAHFVCAILPKEVAQNTYIWYPILIFMLAELLRRKGQLDFRYTQPHTA